MSFCRSKFLVTSWGLLSDLYMQKSSAWEAPLNCSFKSVNNEQMEKVQVNDGINEVSQCHWFYPDDLRLQKGAHFSCEIDWQDLGRDFLPLGLMKRPMALKINSIFPLKMLAIYCSASYNPYLVTYIFSSKECPGRKNYAFPSHKTPFPFLY